MLGWERLPSTHMSPERSRSRSASKVAASQVRRSLPPVTCRLIATVRAPAGTRGCGASSGVSSIGTARRPLLPCLDRRPVLWPPGTGPDRVCQEVRLRCGRHVQGNRLRRETGPGGAAIYSRWRRHIGLFGQKLNHRRMINLVSIMSGPDGNWRRGFQLHQRCIGPTGSYAMSALGSHKRTFRYVHSCPLLPRKRTTISCRVPPCGL